jgi:hypothetical protein
VARRFLAEHAAELAAPLDELGAPEVLPLGGGAVVTFRQRHLGVEVVGGQLVVRIDAAGQVRRVAGRTWDTRGVGVTPRVDLSQARAAVRVAAPLSPPDAPGVLVLHPTLRERLRLLWAVRPPARPELLENAIYLVDAESGRVVRRVELLRTAKFNVFGPNPTLDATADPIDVAADFEPTATNTDGKLILKSALIEGLNCVDRDQTVNFMGINAHTCTLENTAVTDPGSDFTAYGAASEPFTAPLNGCPNAPYGSGMRQPLDEFAEQHMYWHAAHTYAFFRELFAENGSADWKLREQPFPVGVNLCTPNFMGGGGGLPNLTGPLVPFDNAFFSPGQNNPISTLLVGGRDAIMFGQGSAYDFAYDGEVISHELGHAVIDTLGKLSEPGFVDEQGASVEPGAMNEGLADYFAAALSGNPALGQYAGRNLPMGEGAVRDIDNEDQCADDRWGEVHQDSKSFSASLWQARVAIAGTPPDAARARKFDRAVLAAVAGFASRTDFTLAAQAVADETALLLDAAARGQVEQSFARHGIWPSCKRVITWSGKAKDVLMIEGTNGGVAPMGAARVPGFVQWKIEVPAGQDSITASLTLMARGGGFGGFGGGDPPGLELVVGKDGGPVTWTADSDEGVYDKSAAFSGTSGKITATLGGLAPGTHHVMILNTGGGATARNISFSTSCTATDNCVPAAPDMGSGDPAMGPGGGCACEVGDGRALPAVPLLLLCALMLFLVLRRRA